MTEKLNKEKFNTNKYHTIKYLKKCRTWKLIYFSSLSSSKFRYVLYLVGWTILLWPSFCALIISATLYCVISFDFNGITSFFSFDISVLLWKFKIFFIFPFSSDELISLLCFHFHLSQVHFGSKPICYSSSVCCDIVLVFILFSSQLCCGCLCDINIFYFSCEVIVEATIG